MSPEEKLVHILCLSPGPCGESTTDFMKHLHETVLSLGYKLTEEREYSNLESAYLGRRRNAMNSMVVVAVISQESCTIGALLMASDVAGVPIILFHQSHCDVSSFLCSMPNVRVVCSYSSFSEVSNHLKRELAYFSV